MTRTCKHLTGDLLETCKTKTLSDLCEQEVSGERERVVDGFLSRWCRGGESRGGEDRTVGLCDPGTKIGSEDLDRTQTRVRPLKGQHEPEERTKAVYTTAAGIHPNRLGLRCYKCSDYTGRCQNVQECTYEDSCISISERGGKTIRQCLRYTDCDNSRLQQMFPSISGFTYRCCSSNMCNSRAATSASCSVSLLAAVVMVMASTWI
ncbi:hypothetical protein WMY93_022288 [Mugilogobius chulae]|uniref:UPAR/Ly6 domain-containing protein n=1 Tax=Mugilogobius chulae TaxID=88201 RepID=A0AAW0NDL8_9GOBI